MSDGLQLSWFPLQILSESHLSFHLDCERTFLLQAPSPQCTCICTRSGLLPGILPKLEGQHYEKTKLLY
jgi:hypothetical protein